jgi:cell division protein FtsB
MVNTMKKKAEPQGFWQQYGRGMLGLFLLALLVHDVFGAHGFLAMRRTQAEIERVQKDIDRINRENIQLTEEVKALKSDPRTIEKIAREDLGLAKDGEVIIKIPQGQQREPYSPVKP